MEVLGHHDYESILREGQNGYMTQVKKYLLIENLIKFI